MGGAWCGLGALCGLCFCLCCLRVGGFVFFCFRFGVLMVVCALQVVARDWCGCDLGCCVYDFDLLLGVVCISCFCVLFSDFRGSLVLNRLVFV